MGPRRVRHIAGPSSHVGKAIEDNLERVLGYLQDVTVGAVGIWGPGGVGKTALLSRINNSIEDDGNSGFDYVIWVVASKYLQLEKLQNDIAMRLDLQSPSQIFDFLENKNFLLLLDGLWKGFNLFEVGIPQPLQNYSIGKSQRKQKVVLTARSEGVCTRMHVHKAIKVGCLEPAEALQLFREVVGETVNSDPEIETLKLKEEVAKECDGLPLALVTIGRAMSNKKTVHQWKDALRKLWSHTDAISGMEGVFSRLKISYDRLEDETEKECFLYCSLWPKDNNISEEELVWCWLGHGLIDLERFETIETAFKHGHSIIANLKKACLLDVPYWSPEAVKMHHVVRELAIRIVGERGSKWIVKEVEAAGQANQALAELKEAEKAFLSFSEDTNFRLPHCSSLSTLILSGGNNLKIDFLGLFPALRCLDLSETHLDELPAIIGDLSELEYLSLLCTRTSELPDEFANLSKLKYLILGSYYSDCRIRIANKVILKLQKLLVLEATGTGVLELDEDPTKAQDVYIALHRMKSVSVRQLKILSLGALELLSHVKVEYLHISNLRTLKTFHSQVLSNNVAQIVSLEITDCVAVEKLMMDSSCLPRLRYLSLKRLPKLREIIWTEVRPAKLNKVEIKNCHELKDVSWVQQFPDVYMLELSDCDGMEYVIAEVQGANPTSDVRQLILKGLPRLRGISDRAIDFPGLEEVKVFGCPELKNASWVRQLSSLVSLILSDCDGMEYIIGDANGANPTFLHLRELELRRLPQLRGMCDRAINFPLLEKVKVFGCHGLKNVSWVLQLPSLVSLILSDCDGMEYIIGDANGANPTFLHLRELELRRLPQLRGICDPVVDFPHLEKVEVFHCPELKSVSWILQLPSLVSLTLSDCDGMEYVIGDTNGANPTFLHLRELELRRLPQLRGICDRAINFPLLERVKVFGCHGLKTVGWVLQLPSLVSLTLSDCEGMEYVIGDVIEANSTILQLKELELRRLPQLHGICNREIDFPFLKKVKVFHCPKLKTLQRLLFKVPSTQNKDLIIKGTQEWWDGLIWRTSA